MDYKKVVNFDESKKVWYSRVLIFKIFLGIYNTSMDRKPSPRED
jgi:hypothetical protein